MSKGNEEEEEGQMGDSGNATTIGGWKHLMLQTGKPFTLRENPTCRDETVARVRA